MTATYDLYKKVSSVPVLGSRLFSAAFALKAPYFGSVLPHVQVMEPHRAEVRVAKHWGVQNHIGTVHAIAVCNGLEAAMGLLAEATVPDGMRWLPKGMDVDYLAKSDSAVVCHAETTPEAWADAPDVPVRVWATRADGTTVVEGTIRLWVTPKPSRG
ncbi:hotdog fold domain-containing protein [Solicola sp. PLA-1-18]|uniref:hotdog fold domain-containing protein n=1 Tax=Solicola sp. PLA-1-18 TaxID=3380532 RepID=UPI003B80E26C